MLISTTLIIYMLVLLALSRLTARKSSNSTFFTGERRSPWYMVAFGMVGASISGVSVVSVPGMVGSIGMTYLQTCMGFIVGYFVVAFVLLPVYYRLRLTTIYSYLGLRLGNNPMKTGSAFFLLSKMAGAAVKFYVACIILQRFLFDYYNIPFALSVVLMVAVIWLYTRRGGIRTLVWTDSFQTLCILLALLFIGYHLCHELNLSAGQALSTIAADSRSQVFVFDDLFSRQNFWKQFVSGIFIVVVMTGLDQDMMQKNLTCKTLREAQKDMCSYGFAFLPVNFLLLALGILASNYAAAKGIALPTAGDELLPTVVASGGLGPVVEVLFVLGIVAASFSTADSALTSLTTCFCVDIAGRPDDERLRHRTHIAMAAVFTVAVVVFRYANSTSLIDAVYTIVSYTYGPLLGLFAMALLTRRSVSGRWAPAVCVASPFVCYGLNALTTSLLGYQFGYELLLLNGLLTFCGLYAFSSPPLPDMSGQ